jgi:hypothetical protein
MKIPPPRWLSAANKRGADWIDVTIWRRGKIDLRRIDVLVSILGVLCVGWYGYVAGWRGALGGALMFTFCVMVGLWFLPRSQDRPEK